MFFLCDWQGYNLPAYESLDEAVQAYCEEYQAELRDHSKISLGVGFVNGDLDRPVFSVAPPGIFIDCFYVELYLWSGWYDPDYAYPVKESED